jgi:hypothetical protein
MGADRGGGQDRRPWHPGAGGRTIVADASPTVRRDAMTATDHESALRKEARERVQKRRDLVGHLVTYVTVNTMFVALWALTGGGYFWPAWVLLGWGVGVVLNVWDVYFRKPITEADVDDEMQRLRR